MHKRSISSGALSRTLRPALVVAAVVGLAGVAGCEGDTGPRGAPGTPGVNGAPGAQGPAGQPGADANPSPMAACVPVSPLPAGLPGSAVALTASGKLVRFNPRTGVGNAPVAILGLAPGESLVGIDFSSADQTLIGVAKNSTQGQVYRIDPLTGEATLLPRIGGSAFVLAGNQYGVDFNPTLPLPAANVPAALRVVGDNEENYRLAFPNLDNYNVVVDGTLAPAGNVVAAAYTNPFSGTPLTTLYTLDSSSNSLVTQGGIDSATNPNSGVLVTIGGLGVDFNDDAGFDIDGVTGIALATLNVGSNPQSTGLYSINLGSGTASCVGTVPAPAGDPVTGFAIPTPDPAMAFGLTLNDQLVSFTPTALGVANVSGPVAITGLQMGETVVGMDVRPLTGGLTIVTRTVGNQGGVYTVNPVSGVATAVPAVAGTLMFGIDAGANGFGIDFNPVPGAIRVMNDTGQNYRLAFPADMSGFAVNVDGAVNPVGSTTTAGYTNNFAGTSSTRLYVIDTGSGELKFQNPPNAGTQTVVGSLGVTIQDGNSGFDIIGGAGVTDAGVNIGNTVSFATLTVGGQTVLYRINLQTGAATAIGNLPVALKGLAVKVRK